MRDRAVGALSKSERIACHRIAVTELPDFDAENGPRNLRQNRRLMTEDARKHVDFVQQIITRLNGNSFQLQT
jgi:hypothetical protein